MPKRGDNIHKRKDGRWEGRYPRERDGKGVIQYSSVYGKTYGEAKEKLKNALVQKEVFHSCSDNSKTFSEVLALWLDNNRIRLKGGTVTKYQNIINAQILPELGEVFIENLDATAINLYLDRKLKSGKIGTSRELSSSYVRTISVIINAAITFAVNEGWRQPLKSPVFKPVPEKRSIKILSQSDQKTLETYLLTGFDLTKAAILIPLYTGLRLGEICALSWDGIAAYADAEEDGTATIVASVHDVTTDKQALDELVSLCNRLELSTVHLMDVVEDFLAG